MSRHEIVASRINSSLLLWSLRGDEGVRTMTGHVNNRNFVGMEVNGLYVACGSETSQVRAILALLCACFSLWPWGSRQHLAWTNRTIGRSAAWAPTARYATELTR